MRELQSFFLFCSGVHHSILKRTPTDLNKYVGIGATIFFTGVFAAIAGAYALFTVFNSYIVSAIFGLLWGLMIFNLDRYIVSTIKKKGSFFRDFISAMPRILLAILIAVVIAKPLELKIFDSEIQSELALMQQENYKTQEDLVRLRFSNDIEKTENQILALKQELAQKTADRNRLDAMAIAEADGTGGSQLRNMGPIYRAKKADAIKAQEELNDLEAINNPLIQSKTDLLKELEKDMATELSTMNKVTLSGFAARIDALDRVNRRSDAVYYAGLFIMLLFIAIETAPIFVKLITARSPYDYVLDKHEHAFAMNHKIITSSLSNVTKSELEFQIQTNSHKTELAIKAEKELANEAVQEHIERLKKQPMLWRELLRKGKLYGLE
jgi:hypothetical protein